MKPDPRFIFGSPNYDDMPSDRLFCGGTSIGPGPGMISPQNWPSIGTMERPAPPGSGCQATTGT